MARPVVELTGMRFGLLEVRERAGHSTSGKVTWLCDCDCGTEVIAVGNNLRSGNTRRCGHNCEFRGTTWDV